MKYRYLLFDADNTLLDFSRAEYDGLTHTFRDLGIELTDALRAEYVALNCELWRCHERGEITRKALLDTRFVRLLAPHGYAVDGSAVERIYRGYLDEGCATVTGAMELVRELQADYALYIITNGTEKTQRRRLHESGLDRYMRDVFISEVVGAQKPTRAFFDYVMAHIEGFVPAAALVIGDSPTSDILGGINAGIDTCHFDPQGKGCPADIVPTYHIAALGELHAILAGKA